MKMNYDINTVLEIQKGLYNVPNNLIDITDFPVINGYNVNVSGRGGGKSTAWNIFSLISYEQFNVQTLVIRANKTEITKFNAESYFDGLYNIIFDDGKNVIEHITHGKYNKIYYFYTEHCYRLGNESDNIDDVKNNEPFAFITSFDKSSDMASSFNKPKLKFILAEEICDNRISAKNFLDFMHQISTVFRFDTNTIVTLLGNISRGCPDILIKMEIYDKIRTTKVPYFVHVTDLGTPIAVRLFDALPEENTEKYLFNKQYFGFDVDGMDIIRGCSTPTELYRKIPENLKYELLDTHYRLFLLNSYYAMYKCFIDGWQDFYYIAKIHHHTPDSSTVTVTDNENYAYNNPYTYYNCGQEFPMIKDFIIKYRRNDVAFEDYACKIAVDSMAMLHGIPNGF